MFHQTRPTLLGSDHCASADSGSTPRQRARLPMVKNILLLRVGLTTLIGVGLIVLAWPSIPSLGKGWGPVSSDEIPVLVATQFIPPFQALKPEQVRVRYFPKEFVPPGALQMESEIRHENGNASFSTVVGIPAGQPVTRTLLADATKERGMAALLRPGKVAVSFEVDRSRAAGGWVRPGDTIAIFEKMPMDLTGRSGNKRQTRLLFSAVDVLAVDRAQVGEEEKRTEKSISPLVEIPENGSQTITVLTNTADAAAIIEAQELGSLSVVLRALGDEWPWPVK